MFVVRVVRRLHATHFARIAAALSFTTLLGVVPLFTVAFAYAAPYSMFEHWQEALEPVIDALNRKQHRLPWLENRRLVLSLTPPQQPRAGP